jgi:membrane-associated phospholipid phosphatase
MTLSTSMPAPRPPHRSASDALAAAPRTRRRYLRAASGLAILGAAALLIDLPVAEWCKAGRVPKELLRLLNLSEVFAHSAGAACILLTALVLDRGLRFPSFRWPAARWPSFQPSAAQERLARMICTTATGGLIVDLIKLLVDRIRPRAADLGNQASAFGTFGDAALAAATASHSDYNSFPSGHAAVATGLAAALAWRYPRGSLLFGAFALSAALQRVATSAHYPSDICLGAALALAGAAVFLGDVAPEETANA